MATGKAGNKSDRKEAKERIEEIKEKGTSVEREYKVKFLIPAAQRRIEATLIKMSGVGFGYKPRGEAPPAGTPPPPPLFSNLDFELSMNSRVALVGACRPPSKS